MRPLVGAAADHHGVGLDRPFAGIQPEALGPARVEAVHGDALADRPSMVGAIVFKVGHDHVAGHVTLGIAPRVRAARKVQGPVRRHKREAVPPITPCLTQAVPLEYDVLHAEPTQLPADR